MDRKDIMEIKTYCAPLFLKYGELSKLSLDEQITIVESINVKKGTIGGEAKEKLLQLLVKLKQDEKEAEEAKKRQKKEEEERLEQIYGMLDKRKKRESFRDDLKVEEVVPKNKGENNSRINRALKSLGIENPYGEREGE